MTISGARSWLINGSLIITGLQCLFLLLAPVLGYPLPYPANLDALQIIGPVFIGYLGAASHYLFRPSSPDAPVEHRHLGSLVIGPLSLYSVVVIAALSSFGVANRNGAPVGAGISVENLSRALSGALALLTATTGVIVANIFPSTRNE